MRAVRGFCLGTAACCACFGKRLPPHTFFFASHVLECSANASYASPVIEAYFMHLASFLAWLLKELRNYNLGFFFLSVER